MKRALICIALMALLSPAYPGGLDTKSDSLRKDAIPVYMEANDYIRREIPFINYVRDIKDAAVYILSTHQSVQVPGEPSSHISW